MALALARALALAPASALALALAPIPAPASASASAPAPAPSGGSQEGQQHLALQALQQEISAVVALRDWRWALAAVYWSGTRRNLA